MESDSVLEDIEKSKAPGPDNVQSEFFNYCGHSKKLRLLWFFRLSCTTAVLSQFLKNEMQHLILIIVK